MSPQERLSVVYTLSGLVVLWIGWAKAVRPRWRRFWDRAGAAIDILVGRDAVKDLASGQTLRSLDPLPDRLAAIEKTQAMQAQTLARVAEALERLGDHERRLRTLEDARDERLATKLETASLLNAVARRDDDLIDVPTYESETES